METGTSRLVIGAVVVAVLVAGLMVVLSQLDAGGGSGDAFAGIPQDGTRLGNEDALVTIHLYEDFQCPACGQFSRETWPDLVESYVKPGDVKIVSETLVFLGSDSLSMARAAIAAGEQDRYWQYAHLLFQNQGAENSGYATDEFLTDLAEKTEGLDVAEWDEARDAGFIGEELNAVQRKANAEEVQGTPTLVISGPGGERKLRGAVPIEDVEAAIKEVGGG